MKKIIGVTICGIISFIIVPYIINSCNKNLFGDIETEIKKESVINDKSNEKIEVYDINKLVSSYDFDYYEEWEDYIEYIINNYLDYKFMSLIDVQYVAKDYFHYRNWKNLSGDDIRNSIIYDINVKVFKNMFKSNFDWTDLPITDNLKAKFSKAGSIAKYYDLPEDLIDRGEQNGFSIIITDNIPKDYESIEYKFLILEDDKNYIDNIYYLGKIMEEYLPPDYVQLELELYDVDYIRDCVYELCVSEEYLMKGSYELTDFDTHISNMNVYSINYKYREKVFNSNGILPIKDYIKDSLEVISYDENSKEAIVKIETEDKKIYYKIKLNIDEYYILEDADVSLYKEENK